eukprot:g1636.t1
MSTAKYSDGSLASLQNRVKRDPESYVEEVKLQLRHYESELEIFKLRPDKKAEHFVELVSFLGHVSHCYPKEFSLSGDDETEVNGNGFVPGLFSVLDQYSSIMHPFVRKGIVQTLILMRNKNLIDPVKFFTLLFPLFRCHDKSLRKMIAKQVIGDMKRINQKGKNHTVNREVQGLVYRFLSASTSGGGSNSSKLKGKHKGKKSSSSSVLPSSNSVFHGTDKLDKEESGEIARYAIDLLIELYRKQIWDDTRTVNAIAEGCLNNDARVVSKSLRFFLGIEDLIEGDLAAIDQHEKAIVQVSKAEILKPNFRIHSKKTKKRMKKLEQAQEKLKYKAKQATDAMYGDGTGAGGSKPRFRAIDKLHDPQGLAIRLFRRLKKAKNTFVFDLRLLMLNLLSRLIGYHKLLVFGIYTYVHRYLTPKQERVTQVLAYLVQACHSLVPCEEVLPCIKLIADNFVSDRCSPEVITVGLNTIRSIAERIPLVLDPEQFDQQSYEELQPLDSITSSGGKNGDSTNSTKSTKKAKESSSNPLQLSIHQTVALWHDLIQYRNYRGLGSKSIVIAARSLLNLIRAVCPLVLDKKHWGKDVTQRLQAANALRTTTKATTSTTDDDNDDDLVGANEEQSLQVLGKYKPAPYGTLMARTEIDGIDLLEKDGEGDGVRKDGILSQADFERIQELKEEKEAEQRAQLEAKITESQRIIAKGNKRKRDRIRQRREVRTRKYMQEYERKGEDEEEEDDDEDLDELENDEEGIQEDGDGELTEGAAATIDISSSLKPKIIDSLVSSDVKVSGDDMMGERFKRRQALEERIAKIREGRDQYGRGINPGAKADGFQRTGGLSNKEKEKKHKNFLMITKKRDVLAKQKRALKVQKRALNRHIKHLKTQGKTLSRIRKKKRG